MEPIPLPSLMRLAFERSVKDVRKTHLTTAIRSALKRRIGTTLRKRLWAVQRAP